MFGSETHTFDASFQFLPFFWIVDTIDTLSINTFGALHSRVLSDVLHHSSLYEVVYFVRDLLQMVNSTFLTVNVTV